MFTLHDVFKSVTQCYSWLHRSVMSGHLLGVCVCVFSLAQLLCCRQSEGRLIGGDWTHLHCLPVFSLSAEPAGSLSSALPDPVHISAL